MSNDKFNNIKISDSVRQSLNSNLQAVHVHDSQIRNHVDFTLDDIRDQTAEQIQKANEQNELLKSNLNQLSELYYEQKSINNDLRSDLVKSRKINIAMMIVSVIAMFAAIAGPIVTLLVNK